MGTFPFQWDIVINYFNFSFGVSAVFYVGHCDGFLYFNDILGIYLDMDGI